MKIKEKMTKDIIVLNIEESFDDASKKMKEYDIGFLPVVKQKKIIGVLTDRDLALVNTKDQNIENYIKKEIFDIEEDSYLEDALNLMKEKKVKRLLVTNNKKVTGILSLSDLLKDTDEKKLLDTIQTIFSINRNEHQFQAKIDEFEL